jgi:hypothetical protein
MRSVLKNLAVQRRRVCQCERALAKLSEAHENLESLPQTARVMALRTLNERTTANLNATLRLAKQQLEMQRQMTRAVGNAALKRRV